MTGITLTGPPEALALTLRQFAQEIEDNGSASFSFDHADVGSDRLFDLNLEGDPSADEITWEEA